MSSYRVGKFSLANCVTFWAQGKAMRVIRIRCAAGLAAWGAGGYMWPGFYTYGSQGAGMRCDYGCLSDLVSKRGCQPDIRLRSQRQQALLLLIGNIECSDELLQQIFRDRLTTRERL